MEDNGVKKLEADHVLMRNIEYLTRNNESGADVAAVCRALGYPDTSCYHDFVIGATLPTLGQIKALSELFGKEPMDLLDMQFGMELVKENDKLHYRSSEETICTEGSEEHMSEMLDEICYFIRLAKLPEKQ